MQNVKGAHMRDVQKLREKLVRSESEERSLLMLERTQNCCVGAKYEGVVLTMRCGPH